MFTICSSTSRGHYLSTSPHSSWLILFSPLYHNLGEVFIKDKALSLPTHRAYNFAIDFLPALVGCTTCPIHRGRQWRNTKMTRWPQVSFALPFHLLVLRLCIDDHGLNTITVKNKYPLPLMTSAFKPLQGTVFFKLDLRKANHLFQLREGDEWKTAATPPGPFWKYGVALWPYHWPRHLLGPGEWRSQTSLTALFLCT